MDDLPNPPSSATTRPPPPSGARTLPGAGPEARQGTAASDDTAGRRSALAVSGGPGPDRPPDRGRW
jgi:hypothetical protein